MTEKEEKKRGRPHRDYDKQVFEGLCHIHCTIDEIEAVFHADQRSIDKWCLREYGEPLKTIYQEYLKGGKASLRRYQMNLAKNNATMAIWLGKQLLGQRDVPLEFEQFNGKLAILLDTLKTIKSEDDLKKNKHEKLVEVVDTEKKELEQVE